MGEVFLLVGEVEILGGVRLRALLAGIGVFVGLGVEIIRMLWYNGGNTAEEREAI